MTNTYHAYLLRLWRVETENGPVWRATLEDSHNVGQHSFADLSQLFAFLMQKTGTAVKIPAVSLHNLSLEEKSNE